MPHILYLSKRARPEIHLTVSLLSTIVIELDTNDYNNLEKAMKYIQSTIGLPLTLSIENDGNIKWYVDAVFVVHKDMRIHTGGLLTMVIGRAYKN